MNLKKLLNARNWMLAFFLIFPVLVLAEQEQPASPDELKPTLGQAIAAISTVQILSRNAYDKLPQNENTSVRFFDAYLNSLDPQKTFFLQSDIEKFSASHKSMLHDIKRGRLGTGFSIFKRYQSRYIQYLDYQLALIDTGLDKLTYDSDDVLQIDRKKSPWLQDEKEQKTFWKKQLVNTVISMVISGKNLNDIAKQLKKRFENQKRQLLRTHTEDIFQQYINAYTMLFDPHTQYFSPVRTENFNIDMSLSLDGIGALLQYENDYTKVARIIPGGPADMGGQLKAGDRIIAVAQGKDGKFEDVIGMRIDDVVQLIRGKKGSTVRLEVLTGNQNDKSRIYSIVRDKVKLEEQSAKASTFNVKQDDRNYRIGVIRIPAFYLDFKAAQAGEPDYKSTTKDVKKLLEQLKKDKVDGIVIDLRGNGGGSLQEAIELTGLFIPEGPTVVVRNSNGNVEPQVDSSKKEFYTGPLAVMVNRLSASASEIFAGAMKDYHRAIIVGSQTYGKGTVQTLQPLNDGQLKLTIAKFYRVSGKSTQNRGVLPDIKFPEVFDESLIGESSLPNALPWDTIKAVGYTPLPTLGPFITRIHNNFDQIEKKLPYFQYVRSLKQVNKDYEGKKTLSLNLEKRKQEYVLLQQNQLRIENILRKAKNKPPFKTVGEMEKEWTTNPYAPEKENPEEDQYLKAAGIILSDYIHLKKDHVLSLGAQDGVAEKAVVSSDKTDGYKQAK